MGWGEVGEGGGAVFIHIVGGAWSERRAQVRGSTRLQVRGGLLVCLISQ